MQKWKMNLKTKKKYWLKMKKLVKKAMNSRIRLYIYIYIRSSICTIQIIL